MSKVVWNVIRLKFDYDLNKYEFESKEIQKYANRVEGEIWEIGHRDFCIIKGDLSEIEAKRRLLDYALIRTCSQLAKCNVIFIALVYAQTGLTEIKEEAI